MNSCVYKIQNLNKGLCYIGSCSNFKTRMSVHKTLSKSDNRLLYKLIRENGGWDEFKKDVMCVTDSLSKEERIKLEREYKELYLDNMSTYKYEIPEARRSYAKSYYEKNKDRVLLRMKNKREIDKNGGHAKIYSADGVQISYDDLKAIGEYIVDDECCGNELPVF